jgi:hypothetical protein
MNFPNTCDLYDSAPVLPFMADFSLNRYSLADMLKGIENLQDRMFLFNKF